jgi:hypothetical protein
MKVESILNVFLRRLSGAMSSLGLNPDHQLQESEKDSASATSPCRHAAVLLHDRDRAVIQFSSADFFD